MIGSTKKPLSYEVQVQERHDTVKFDLISVR